MRELFINHTFRKSTMELILTADQILSDYFSQGFVLTVRQTYYQFVARDLLANTEKNYKALIGHVKKARQAGLLDWDHLEDRTRSIETHSAWDSPADILISAAQTYQEDLWSSQDWRCEVWIEKSALLGVVRPACDRWRLPYGAARGYSSHSELYAAGKRIEADRENGLDRIIFYLGDHDPSGLDMTRSLRETLGLYSGGAVTVIRLGLNIDQINLLALPPNPAKETDSRYAAYVAETGCTESWELDALSPSFIDQLIDQAVVDRINMTAWDEAKVREQQNKQRVFEIADEWA